MKCHVSCILRAHKDTDTGPKGSPTSFPGSLSLRRAGTGWREPWERGRGKAPSTPRSNAGACAMHLYPVAGRENFPRENLIETIAETGVTRKKVERQ